MAKVNKKEQVKIVPFFKYLAFISKVADNNNNNNNSNDTKARLFNELLRLNCCS